ncbi:hypothetical protein Syun_000733 [Stephania yunnanensis]|uniref:Coiled-coil SMC6 And NSE5 INteracting (CANIN) domain-containing protein n=1 Tax=Stephania yunnanensis TaxID=152371 RepID=A0AAP0Q6E5_9MAGN
MMKKVEDLNLLYHDAFKTKRKCKSNSLKAPIHLDDEEDIDQNSKEALLSHFVDECQKQVQGIKTDDEIPLWGLRVFGNQKSFPTSVLPEIQSCKLLQSFVNNDLNSGVELSVEKGQVFLEGLLINGWLARLALTGAHVEKSIARWVFNLMLYSSNEELRAAACDFWCSILPLKDEVDRNPIRIDWFPGFPELKGALEAYGFLLDSSVDFSSLAAKNIANPDSEGPPQNIRFWVKFLIACCQARYVNILIESQISTIISSSVAEKFLGVIICLFLERRLQGLSFLLYECMLSIISVFADEEWSTCCEKLAKSLARRTKKDLNCLRLVECISGVNPRSKQLRSELAFQILVICFNSKLMDIRNSRLLISINVKEKDCDFLLMYIYLALTENWLFSNPLMEEKPLILEIWGVYLRNCSCQITSTDMRSYASKVRNKASYLLQSTHRKDKE